MSMDDSYQESKEEILAGAIEDIVADTGLWSKEEAFYLDKSPYGQYKCSSCTFYMPAREGVCDVIREEPINADGYCRFYSQVESEEINENNIELSLHNLEVDQQLLSAISLIESDDLKDFEIETLIENTFLMCMEEE